MNRTFSSPGPGVMFVRLTMVLIAAALLVSGVSAGTASAAKVTQPSCGKFVKKQRKARTGAKKRAAARQLKSCKANALVYRQVKDSIFVGFREDGVDVNTIYCANGKSQDGYGTDFAGDVNKLGWKVYGARVRSPKKFTAIVEAKIPGGSFVQAVGRNGSQWQVGYESGDRAQALGDVVKTDAKKDCAQL